MDLFTDELVALLRRGIVDNLVGGRVAPAAESTDRLVRALHASIPDKKRVSYGIYYCVRTAGERLYEALNEATTDSCELCSALYDHGADDKQHFRSKGPALSALSLCALEGGAYLRRVLGYFERAADADYWDLREYAAGFFPRVIKRHPQEARSFLSRLATSESPNVRRFVAETLRPVRENRWFLKSPDFHLTILRPLFTESHSYPRASVGNGLSDLSRSLPELVCSIVEELMALSDKNAVWIAHRACRNLVKKEPLRVMDLLGVDEYRYKKQVYRRADHR